MSEPVGIFSSRTKDIVRYTESRVRLTEGAFNGELINLRQRSPWMVKPLEMWEDDRVSNMLLLKGTGCGGTYVAECGSLYFTTVRPRNVGYQIWTKEKAAYLSNRLFKKCEAAAEYTRRIPKKAQATKNQSIWFDWPISMTLVQEASQTNANTVRLDDMVGDEPWQYPQGRWTEFKKRTDGASPFSTIVGVSTAPRSPEHDYYLDWEQGCQDEYHLACPKCHQLFLVTIGEESQELYDAQVVHWDREGSIDVQANTCRIICPNCQAEYRDKPSTRLDLLEGADYVPSNPDAPYEFYSCRWNSWVAWFVPFRDLLGEYLKGEAAIRTGDHSVIEDYIIKREARPWSGFTANDRKIDITGDYKLIKSEHPVPSTDGAKRDLWHAPDWEREDPFNEETGYYEGRIGGVDVQKSELWAWFIQASSRELGVSRLLWCGRLRTWAELSALEEFFKIPPWQIGVDISYGRGMEVANQIIENGWTALRGDEDHRNQGYVHNWEEEDEKGRTRLSYSEPIEWDIGAHKHWEEGMPTELDVYQWSHGRIMDHTWNLRNGDGAYWGLPSNLEILEDHATWTEQERILAQLDSSRRVPKTARTANNATSKNVPTTWKKRAPHVADHLWDCCCMATTLMHMQRFFTPHEEDADEDKSEPES